jgi:hypothetical protein
MKKPMGWGTDGGVAGGGAFWARTAMVPSPVAASAVRAMSLVEFLMGDLSWFGEKHWF